MVIQTAAERLPVVQRLAVTPRKKQRTPCVLPAASRGMGIFFCATRGSGKSRALGRCLAWSDLTAGVPLVIIDPVGGTIDNLLDRIRRRPLDEQEQLWPRIRYVNMAGQAGRVITWPIYYEATPGERFSDRAQRYIENVRRADPALQSASVQGYNALAPIAQAAGIVLSALGLGITEMWDLVNDPKSWEPRLEQVAREHPETVAAVDELRLLGALQPHASEPPGSTRWVLSYRCSGSTRTLRQSSGRQRQASIGMRLLRKDRLCSSTFGISTTRRSRSSACCGCTTRF
jgi:hypothetical protein